MVRRLPKIIPHANYERLPRQSSRRARTGIRNVAIIAAMWDLIRSSCSSRVGTTPSGGMFSSRMLSLVSRTQFPSSSYDLGSRRKAPSRSRP